MAQSYSLGVSQQEIDSTVLDHVLPGSMLDHDSLTRCFTNFMFLLSQGGLRELRKFSNININGRDYMRKNNAS